MGDLMAGQIYIQWLKAQQKAFAEKIKKLEPKPKPKPKKKGK